MGDTALVRIQSPMTRKEVEAMTVADLSLGELDLVNVETARAGVDAQGNKLWVPSMQLTLHDFYVWQVARATSAAPGFLPPAEVSPSDGLTKEDGSWPRPRTFVDGGLANNDPTWMGVGLMLMLWGARRQAQHEAVRKGELPGAAPKPLTFVDTAVFSVGTGQSQTWGALHDGPFSGGPITGLLRALALLGDLVSLTMAVNGEDKQSILRLIYYGLLRLPEGQYMRIQLPFGDTTAAEPTAGLSSQRSTPAVPTPTPGLTREELAALDKMDDPDPDVLKVYEQLGQKLVARYEKRIDWWVRCFLLGLDNPFNAVSHNRNVGPHAASFAGTRTPRSAGKQAPMHRG
ncbi:hypothetical protein MNEG_11525 [Monoraphidium neglectum]|uniref:Patatin n=1 Tax=Monoraphidium neglectum TaxID=145388 RepID=A0A0D2J9J6_9CHLO|nr:hypothetical protein MNEG_11525 [Monoraphidium neglectum]KIY96437.1 hypothetical protein MNEG_11525 [Monoraphidium neglectum]|eukprot:XP_013895457.1 hypothetical protein MNEG_11525 [Monoraphidium neglectum]